MAEVHQHRAVAEEEAAHRHPEEVAAAVAQLLQAVVVAAAGLHSVVVRVAEAPELLPGALEVLFAGVLVALVTLKGFHLHSSGLLPTEQLVPGPVKGKWTT